MNVLITGNISTIALSLAKKLLKAGNSVVVTNASDDFSGIKSRNFTAYKMNATDALFQEIYRSHSFDTVFFISSLDDHLLDIGDLETTQSNISLENTLDLCQKTGVNRFIFISSTEVYGNSGIALEEAQPEPSTKSGKILLNGENLCRFYAKNHALTVSIVRVPYIYGPYENNSFLFKLIKAAKVQENIDVTTHELSN